MHRSIFMESYFDESIRPNGYIFWGSTDPRITESTFMAVYEDFGPGWHLDELRANTLTRVLDAGEVSEYRRAVDVFITASGAPGNVDWIDQSVIV